MLEQLEISPDLHLALMRYCAEKDIEFMSTAFDVDSLEFLVKHGMQRLKIPSGEITNYPLIRAFARYDLPIILSTGMSTMEEVQEAVDVIADVRKQLNFHQPLKNVLTVLHCTSNYPTAMEDVNLRAMVSLSKTLDLSVGYSDHTAGILISPLAVALGATVIEKHFTLDKSLPGPDHCASLDPIELKLLVNNIRAVRCALGTGVKQPCAKELEVRDLVRRSVALLHGKKQEKSLRKMTLFCLDLGQVLRQRCCLNKLSAVD